MDIGEEIRVIEVQEVDPLPRPSRVPSESSEVEETGVSGS